MCEGPPPITLATDEEIEFRHSGWLERRRLVTEAMQRAGFTPNRLERFANCGARAQVWTYDDDDGGFSLRGQFCHDRYCQPCSRSAALNIADNLRFKMDNGEYVHCVLTLKHTDAPLAAQVNRIFKAFSKLRRDPIWLGRPGHSPTKMPRRCTTKRRKQRWKAARHKLKFRWKSHTTGGAFFIQMHVAEDGCWHVHFHIIGQAHWLPQRQLSAAWHRVTGDSYNVHVSRIGDRDAAAKEVARYASMPVDKGLVTDADRLAEMMRALHGRHLSATYGNWRGSRLTERCRPCHACGFRLTPRMEVCPNCQTDRRRPQSFVGELTDIITLAKAGDPHYQQVLKILATKTCAARPPPPAEPQP
jgi:hypothetical protein